MSIVDKLKWRYATKKFDATKKIAADKLEYILDAIQLAPSSTGLQHFQVLVIENPEIRAQLREASYGQPQITDASHLVVFAAEHLTEEHGQRYLDNVARTRHVDRESLSGLEGLVMGGIKSRTPEQRLLWAQKQAYIALGILIAATSEQEVDSAPMEGFDPEQYNQILGLTEKGLSATVIAAIGYRAEDDAFAKLKKVRKPKDELFIRI